MFKRLLSQTISNPSPQPNPPCPKCHNPLEYPPSLEDLQASEKAKHIKFNTSIDRSLLSCRICAWKQAKDLTSEISTTHLSTTRQTLETKISQANDLIFKNNLEDEALENRLKAQKSKWEEERAGILREELKVRNFEKLKNKMVKTVDLIDQGVYREELGGVLEEMKGERARFEIEWERRYWMPYWAVWGWNDEMPL